MKLILRYITVITLLGIFILVFSDKVALPFVTLKNSNIYLPDVRNINYLKATELLENLDFNIQSADKILSYRVLECGILLESSKNRTYRNGGLDNIRHARTKLHIRVIDAKTGRIEF